MGLLTHASLGRGLRGLAASFVLIGPLPASGESGLDQLIAQLQAMPGLTAHFEEEKRIALLEEPLRSSGSVHFLPPNRLIRRVDEPLPSLLRLEDERLVYTDASGSESFDLGANGLARVFAHTFTDILAGDVERLRAIYEIEFQPEGPQPWKLELRPRDPALRKAIAGISLRGRGLALVDLDVRESSGDSTLTRFADVDAERRFSPAEVEELLRPPHS